MNSWQALCNRDQCWFVSTQMKSRNCLNTQRAVADLSLRSDESMTGLAAVPFMSATTSQLVLRIFFVVGMVSFPDLKQIKVSQESLSFIVFWCCIVTVAECSVS